MEIEIYDNLNNFFMRTLSELVEERKLDVSDDSTVYVAGVLSRGLLCDESISEKILQADLSKSYYLSQVELQKIIFVGDNCLLSSGYFYDSIRKKGEWHVDLYYKIGTMAYSTAADTLENKMHDGGLLYQELADNFNNFSLVIGDLREPELDNIEKLFYYVDKWKQTRDPRYKELLSKRNLLLDDSEN